jgi:hypothetical protein
MAGADVCQVVLCLLHQPAFGIPRFWFTSSDKVARVTLSASAASVIVSAPRYSPSGEARSSSNSGLFSTAP